MAIQFHKAVTTAGTQVAIAASGGARKIAVKALLANTNNIYVGGSDVAAANGFELDAGQEIQLIPPDYELSNVWIDSDTNGEGVSVLVLEAA